MADKKLMKLARAGRLNVATPHGIVDVSQTATIWGEGPNVYGFRWARGELNHPPLTEKDTDKLFCSEEERKEGLSYFTLVKGWAEHRNAE